MLLADGMLVVEEGVLMVKGRKGFGIWEVGIRLVVPWRRSKGGVSIVESGTSSKAGGTLTIQHE